MLPCVKKSPADNLEEMQQNCPTRDANQHPRRRPEALFNRYRMPVHPVNSRDQAHRVYRHANTHQAPSYEKLREHCRSNAIASEVIYREFSGVRVIWAGTDPRNNLFWEL
jgi:hypothetical protein